MIFLFRTLGYNSKSRISYLFFFFLPLVTFFIFHMFLSLVGKFGLHPFCLYQRKRQDLQGEKQITCVQTICYKDLKSLYNSFNQKFQLMEETCRLALLSVFGFYRCGSSIEVIFRRYPEYRGLEFLKLFRIYAVLFTVCQHF